jgi:hypothetical protein
MQMLMMLLMFVGISSASDAPAVLERESYRSWLQEIGSVESIYLDSVFAWYEEQKNSPLPPSVEQDPDQLVVSVEKPLQDTIEAEANGDIEKGVTYGLETYGVVNAPIQVVLETILFRWGKPIGASAGVTYPFDMVFGFRQETLAPHWGPTAYRTETLMKSGGVAKDQSDVSSLVLRGDATNGYDLVGSFYGAKGKTASTSSISIIWLRPTGEGKTEYRVSGRYTGQSYALFGIEFGRRNYGFNLAKIRQGQKDFYAMVEELKTTGKIRERRPNSGFMDLSPVFP